MSATVSLKMLLADHTMPAHPDLVRREEKGVRCLACGHRCLVKPGRSGVCRVRFNRDGELRVPAGYVSGLQVDPIEKKPFYHALPGRDALSFGMLSCSFHCPFCQNWVTSQTLRDDQAVSMPRFCTAKQLADLAVEHGAPAVVSTYNEPLITSEWAVEVFKEAKAHGLMCGYVSNGNGTPEVLAFLRPYLDLINVDLKCFDDRRYRKLGGVLAKVLATIEQLVSDGYWVEIVTLVVPGFNDSDDELTRMAKFIAGISRDIPWHVTAFHPDYKMQGPPRTPAATLVRAYDIGKAAGLMFVYPGNVHGGVGDRENTFCPACNELVIRRSGFYVEENRMTSPGKCPACDTSISGVWEDTAPHQSDGTGIPRPVRP
ncbi:MAG: AmmeMemoRadiSam system radical SAM enzyme [Phycisphaerae bacterium]|nr:AmmeMemoRadiSam system radical SAM enzyme [Phycisphaerae bacterium]